MLGNSVLSSNSYKDRLVLVCTAISNYSSDKIYKNISTFLYKGELTKVIKDSNSRIDINTITIDDLTACAAVMLRLSHINKDSSIATSLQYGYPKQWEYNAGISNLVEAYKSIGSQPIDIISPGSEDIASKFYKDIKATIDRQITFGFESPFELLVMSSLTDDIFNIAYRKMSSNFKGTLRSKLSPSDLHEMKRLAFETVLSSIDYKYNDKGVPEVLNLISSSLTNYFISSKEHNNLLYKRMSTKDPNTKIISKGKDGDGKLTQMDLIEQEQISMSEVIKSDYTFDLKSIMKTLYRFNNNHFRKGNNIVGSILSYVKYYKLQKVITKFDSVLNSVDRVHGGLSRDSRNLFSTSNCHKPVMDDGYKKFGDLNDIYNEYKKLGRKPNYQEFKCTVKKILIKNHPKYRVSEGLKIEDDTNANSRLFLSSSHGDFKDFELFANNLIEALSAIDSLDDYCSNNGIDFFSIPKEIDTDPRVIHIFDSLEQAIELTPNRRRLAQLGAVVDIELNPKSLGVMPKSKIDSNFNFELEKVLLNNSVDISTSSHRDVKPLHFEESFQLSLTLSYMLENICYNANAYIKLLSLIDKIIKIKQELDNIGIMSDDLDYDDTFGLDTNSLKMLSKFVESYNRKLSSRVSSLNSKIKGFIETEGKDKALSRKISLEKSGWYSRYIPYTTISKKEQSDSSDIINTNLSNYSDLELVYLSDNTSLSRCVVDINNIAGSIVLTLYKGLSATEDAIFAIDNKTLIVSLKKFLNSSINTKKLAASELSKIASINKDVLRAMYTNFVLVMTAGIFNKCGKKLSTDDTRKVLCNSDRLTELFGKRGVILYKFYKCLVLLNSGDVDKLVDLLSCTALLKPRHSYNLINTPESDKVYNSIFNLGNNPSFYIPIETTSDLIKSVDDMRLDDSHSAYISSCSNPLNLYVKTEIYKALLSKLGCVLLFMLSKPDYTIKGSNIIPKYSVHQDFIDIINSFRKFERDFVMGKTDVISIINKSKSDKNGVYYEKELRKSIAGKALIVDKYKTSISNININNAPNRWSILEGNRELLKAIVSKDVSLVFEKLESTSNIATIYDRIPRPFNKPSDLIKTVINEILTEDRIISETSLSIKNSWTPSQSTRDRDVLFTLSCSGIEKSCRLLLSMLDKSIDLTIHSDDGNIKQQNKEAFIAKLKSVIDSDNFITDINTRFILDKSYNKRITDLCKINARRLNNGLIYDAVNNEPYVDYNSERNIFVFYIYSRGMFTLSGNTKRLEKL